MKKLFILLIALSGAGCSSLEREFDNSLVCTVDGKAFFVSMYGPVGIASKIDTTGICGAAAQGAQK